VVYPVQSDAVIHPFLQLNISKLLLSSDRIITA
jgi:hypothetical protein